MKRWQYLLVIFLLVWAVGAAEARSYRILSTEIEALVGADGVLRVTETHTVQFEGRYSGMFQWFDSSRGISFTDLAVSEGGVPYTLNPGDSPGPAGTYFIREEKDQVYLDWSFEAEDEIKRFAVSYNVHNAVLKHRDAAELYYQFIGKEWEVGRDQVRVVVRLPHGAELDQVRAWGYGPSHGTVSINSPTEVAFAVENLPARTFLEGRIVFPNSLVPLGTRTTNESIYERLQGEAERAEQKRRMKALDPYLAGGVAAAVILLLVWFYYSQIKRDASFNERYYKILPGTYPPAELAVLFHRMVQGKEFTATLLDLARRGLLTISEIEGEEDYLLKLEQADPRELAKLRSYERMLLEKVFAQGQTREVRLEEFKKRAEQDRKGFEKFWQEWTEAVKKSAERHNFFDKEAKRLWWLLVPSLALTFAAVVTGILGLTITTVVCVILGLAAVMFVATAAMRYSPYGQEQYAKWKAFRRYLRDFSRVGEARVGSLGIWEEYLPYAVVLGIAERMLKQLELKFPNLEQDGYLFGHGWFIYYHPHGFRRMSNMTSTLESSLNSAVLPPGSGTGGGFSGGGGGGFGGGGGGAR